MPIDDLVAELERSYVEAQERMSDPESSPTAMQPLRPAGG